jgi:hypothetical protein
MPNAPRKMLLNDEGSSALYYFDFDAPHNNWVHHGAGRDLQLIGQHRVLRSTPRGFTELDLARGGEVVREVAVIGAPGGIESARRRASGNTVVLGNGAGGIFVWEVDREGEPLAGRRHVFAGLDKGRLLRVTDTGTFLFCSDTEGKRCVREADAAGNIKMLFQVPADVPADSMVKSVRIAPDVITVSTGYAASLLCVDTTRGVIATIGGRASRDDSGKRPLSPFFFSGYQMFDDGDFLVANWQGHGAGHNGQGYQVLHYDRHGTLVWRFDQTEFPMLSSINNVLALDGLDTSKLHDEPNGVQVPL